jgi:hypothetical protein
MVPGGSKREGAAVGAPVELAHLLVPCLRCGCTIALGAPHRLRVNPAPGGAFRASLDRVGGYGGPGLCVDCRVELAPATEGARLRAEFDQMLALKDELGMPADSLGVWIIFSDQGNDPSWRGFAAQLFGA